MSKYSDLAKMQLNKSSEPEPITPIRHHDSMPLRLHDSIKVLDDDAPTEAIRKAVRPFGKEVTSVRLTTEEKDSLSDLVYSFKKKKIRTSENEIVRIAINYLLQDYSQNKSNGILESVLRELNS